MVLARYANYLLAFSPHGGAQTHESRVLPPPMVVVLSTGTALHSDQGIEPPSVQWSKAGKEPTKRPTKNKVTSLTAAALVVLTTNRLVRSALGNGRECEELVAVLPTTEIHRTDGFSFSVTVQISQCGLPPITEDYRDLFCF